MEESPAIKTPQTTTTKKIPWTMIGVIIVLIGIGITTVVVLTKQTSPTSKNTSQPKTSTPTTQNKNDTNTQTSLYPCTSTSGSTTETVPDYDVVDLFAVKTNTDGVNYNRLTSPPTISLSEFF